MQLISEKGYEDGETEGLGWISGEVKPIPLCGQRIPHMGWNNIDIIGSGPLQNLEDKNFYFMHSFYFDAGQQYITSTVDHGTQVVATVQKENIFGAQFHPEKSQTNGLAYLQYVLNYPC
jgi:glutamine amidotransferase